MEDALTRGSRRMFFPYRSRANGPCSDAGGVERGRHNTIGHHGACSVWPSRASACSPRCATAAASISAVEPFDGDSGRLHLVHLEYKDDQLPARGAAALGARAAQPPPRADRAARTSRRRDPMPAEDFDALLRAARWTAASPYPRPGRRGTARAPADLEPVPRRGPGRGLPARAAAQGAADAAGQPADRRRRRASARRSRPG